MDPETILEQGAAVLKFEEHLTAGDGIQLEMSMPVTPYFDAAGLEIG